MRGIADPHPGISRTQHARLIQGFGKIDRSLAKDMTILIREKCENLATRLVSLEGIKLVELKRSDELRGVRAASAESRTQPPPHMSGQFRFRGRILFQWGFRLAGVPGIRPRTRWLGVEALESRTELKCGWGTAHDSV